METQELIKKRAKLAFEILAKNQGIEIEEKDYPKITTKDEKNATYDTENNTINIPQEYVNSLSSYFEEASHALRYYVERKKLINRILPYKPDVLVDEFYGRIGETLGRHLVEGTELESLLYVQEERDFTSDDSKKKLDNRLESIEKNKSKIENAKNIETVLLNEIQEHINERHDFFCDRLYQFSQGEIEFSQFYKDLGNLVEKNEEHYNLLGKKNLNKLCTGLTEEVGDYYKWIKDVHEIVGDVINEPKEEVYTTKRIKTLRDFAYKESKKDAPVLMNLNTEVENKELELMLEEYSYHSHIKPYQFAERLGIEEIKKIPNLYKLSNREVRNKYFKEKAPKKKYGFNFLIISLLVLQIALIFDNPVTGAFTSINSFNEYSIINFLLLFITMLVIIAYIIKKK